MIKMQRKKMTLLEEIYADIQHRKSSMHQGDNKKQLMKNSKIGRITRNSTKGYRPQGR